MVSHSVILTAHAFAAGAHGAINQRRKYTNEPYIVHPIEVMNLVLMVPHDLNMLAAALLHDVEEDTKVTNATIAEIFGDDVAYLVNGLTKVTKPEDGNRATRSAIERDRLAKACARIQTIKVADLISNTSSIVDHDPKFAAVYLAEKRELLDVMTLADRRLRQFAYDTLAEAYAKLEVHHE